jgi:hypothetical protein
VSHGVWRSWSSRSAPRSPSDTAASSCSSLRLSMVTSPPPPVSALVHEGAAGELAQDTPVAVLAGLPHVHQNVQRVTLRGAGERQNDVLLAAVGGDDDACVASWPTRWTCVWSAKAGRAVAAARAAVRARVVVSLRMRWSSMSARMGEWTVSWCCRARRPERFTASPRRAPPAQGGGPSGRVHSSHRGATGRVRPRNHGSWLLTLGILKV